MKTVSPNLVWIISMLIIVIILLISYIICVKFTDDQLVMSYISCASVILSITLSIFAILYTYVSNVQVQQQFEKINAAAESIKDTSNKLILTEGKIGEFLSGIENHLNLINTNQLKMTEEITNVNAKIGEQVVNNISNS